MNNEIKKLIHALSPTHTRMAKMNGPRMFVSCVFTLTVCMASIVESSHSDICLHCEDLNRMDSQIECPKQVKECGECFKGMMPVSWDISCTPVDLEILANPKNASGTIGKSVILKCRASHEVDCEWQRQGRIIYAFQDQQHYQYVNYKSGIPSKNCDLEIKSYRMEDSSWWECHIFTDYDRVRSSKAWLVPNGQVMLLGHPLHAVAQTKKEVVLNCKFNLPVQCEWLHKNKLVRMKKGVYRFLEKSNEPKREDCSMVISSFKRKDAGEWQCRNVPTDREPRVSSNKAVLYDTKSAPGKCTKLDEKLILHCYMREPGECSWQRNKSVVQIAQRYKYVIKSPKDATDCSIIIEKFRAIDAVEWQCGSNSNDAQEGTFENKASPQMCKRPSPPPKKGKISKRSISPLTDASLPFVSPQVEQHPPSGNYYLGDNVTLPCVFSKSISDCFWLRNDHNVVIAHRYQYMDGKNGRHTADCSITIRQFQATDIGSWLCGNIADDEHNGVMSDASYLDVIDYNDSGPDDGRENVAVDQHNGEMSDTSYIDAIDYDDGGSDDGRENVSDDQHNGEMSDTSYLDAIDDDGSYDWNKDEPALEVKFFHDDEIIETQKEDEMPQSDNNTVIVYLSIALSMLSITIVILLLVVLFVWFKKSHRQHAVPHTTKHKYVAMNNTELIMEDEMNNAGSQTKLIKD